MAQTAKTEAERAINNVAELGKRTADKAVDVTHEAADQAENTTRRGFQAVQETAGAVASRSAEGAAEVGQAFADFANEQTRQGVETFQALTRTLDWNEATRIQCDFLSASLERTAEFTKRYFEVVQAVVASPASTTKEQARKVA
jgi:hypothetical protein